MKLFHDLEPTREPTQRRNTPGRSVIFTVVTFMYYIIIERNSKAFAFTSKVLNLTKP